MLSSTVVPHTMLSPPAVPHTMLSPPLVPHTMLSPPLVPQTMLSPPFAVRTASAPHITVVDHALPSGLMYPPEIMWLPHIRCRLQELWIGITLPTLLRA